MVKITRRKVGALLGLLACGLGAASLASASASGSSPAAEAQALSKEVRDLAPASEAELTNIYAKASEVAAQAGEPSPSGMETTVATMGSALTMADPDSTDPKAVIDPRTGAPWSESAVDVVAMRGHFALTQVPVRKGAQAPTGTSMLLFIDRQTERVDGIYLGTNSYDLATLNPTVVKWGEP